MSEIKAFIPIDRHPYWKYLKAERSNAEKTKRSEAKKTKRSEAEKTKRSEVEKTKESEKQQPNKAANAGRDGATT
ncbi:hypothetical protein K432DRAFT_407628 [Lepidopterella palustris CBS 459.81]|uniref:Uncharacterized protein n=1 Tax=Lepidopterella palustris CBS 459.81 TaxID=1314670 RepID=A0A8E2E4C3_9PEZI|nr:hypothetical protein K432DRAFT_407628 [Lepidopterella palustris CBS 459.81]